MALNHNQGTGKERLVGDEKGLKIRYTAENLQQLNDIEQKVIYLLDGLSAGNAKWILKNVGEQLDNNSIVAPFLFVKGEHDNA